MTRICKGRIPLQIPLSEERSH